MPENEGECHFLPKGNPLARLPCVSATVTLSASLFGVLLQSPFAHLA